MFMYALKNLQGDMPNIGSNNLGTSEGGGLEIVCFVSVFEQENVLHT